MNNYNQKSFIKKFRNHKKLSGRLYFSRPFNSQIIFVIIKNKIVNLIRIEGILKVIEGTIETIGGNTCFKFLT